MAGHWATKASRLLGDQGRVLYRIAFALTGDHAAAERLLHRGLAKAFKTAKRETTHDEMVVLARRAVYSASLEAPRGKAGRKGPESTTEQPDRFLAALATLDAQQRLCLVMRFYEGLSAAAIAKDLDVLPVTVRRYLDSAIETLGRPLEDLGLTRDILHYGGWTPGEKDSDASQLVPSDTLSIGFTRVDDLASTQCPLPPHVETPQHIVKAATRPKRGRTWMVAGLTVLALGSLGAGGWAAVQAFDLFPEPGPEASPSPSSVYGMGVLASDDVLAESASWYGQRDVQRVLVCDTSAWTPETDNGEDGIPVTSGDVDRRGNYYETYELYSGSCSQQQTDALSVSAAIVPFEGTSRRHSIQVIVTIRNDSEYSVAILEDSIGLYFELPWEAISFMPSADETLLYLSGSKLNDPSLESMVVLSDEATVLEPGEEISALFNVWVLPDDFETMISEEQAAELTPELVEEIRRSSSLIGEMSETDPVLDAFRSGEYIPPAGLALTVAPSDPESTQIVILWIVQDQVGEPPANIDPSPSASPSPSATP